MLRLKSFSNAFFHFFPGLFWGSYAERARELSITQPLVLLSFDSDTDQDAEASQKLFARLSALNIPATFAVPGAQLEKGAAIYQALKDQGAQFVNHGGGPHTEFRQGRYWSVGFYNQMSPLDVRADIRKGHRIFESVLGQAPQGFRAPHFGHFQKDQDLDLIHDELGKLGTYRFCSSSMSPRARRLGPVIPMNGLLEIPVTGTYAWPTRIFDSYGHLISKQDRRVTDLYAAKLSEALGQFREKEIPVLLNYYADPSHVADNSAYFEALEEAVDFGLRFVDFNQLLEMVNSEKVRL